MKQGRQRLALRRGVAVLALVTALAGCRQETRRPIAARPVAPRPDIVLVVLDTLRRDFTGLGDESYTPHLDRFAGTATVLPRAWANGPWTVPSHASIFTGALPSVHGCTSRNPRFASELPTLAELLEGSGYRTAAFFSNPWLGDGISGLLRGFRERHVAPILGGAVEGGWEQGGPETVENLRRWLGRRSGGEPAFLYVNLLEPHAPYDPPPSVRRDLGGLDGDRIDAEWIFDYQAGLRPPETVDWRRVRRLYGGDVLFADRLFGELVELFDDEAVLIVTSDHGENLGEHGAVEHQFRLDETLLAVPLVVRAPGLPPGRQERPVQLSDLFATVLELAGVDADVPASSRSLLTGPANPRRPLIAEYGGAPAALLRHLAARNPAFDATPVALRSVRVGDLRLTVDDRGGAVLHDLASDPGQELDLSAAMPDETAALRRLLAEVLPDPPAGEAGDLELSEEERERLRSLGYIP